MHVLTAVLLLVASAPEDSVLIEGVPHVLQKPDFCGEACAEMHLRKLGFKTIDQDRVFEHTGLDPALGRGAWTRELKPALESIGYDVGPVWVSIDPQRADEGIEREWRRLVADLRKDIPSIVCMHYDDTPNTTEHFRLVLGYDAKTDEVIFHDPAVKDGAYKRMKKPLFFALWTFKPRADRWMLIRFPLVATDRIEEEAKRDHKSAADYAQHVLKLKEKLPPGFHIAVEPPFVVIGDETATKVKERAERTVRWTVELLKKDYFDRDPDRIIDVWLLKDKASYEKTAKRLTGETPDTPYGFYSPRLDAMIMNIRPGAGTLVHEIVHPYVEANFTDCPAWFNEGLGSLYEYASERDGHIYGHTNWRLPALQHAIEHDRAPSLKPLMETTSDEFYNDDSGLHYAAARYLLYALQEKHVLAEYYRRFHANHGKDPSGYRTLLEVLGEKDLSKFEPKWRRFVVDLKRDG
jgi:hypothetical protein